MAVRVTSEVERPYSGNWNEWLPDTRPDISDLNLWGIFNPGWRKVVTGLPVDDKRTLLMAGWDKAIRTDTTRGTVQGVHAWIPFQRLDKIPTRMTKIYEATTPPNLFNWFPSKTIPLPDYVSGRRETVLRRFGDPTVTGSDAQSFLINPTAPAAGFYYEISAFGPSFFPYSFRADSISVWDLSKDWRTQKAGITGAKIPLLPMIPTYEEYETSIEHAIHFVASGYAPEKTGIAKGTDGTIVGHPLRAGERLRMKESAAELALAQPDINKHDRALINALVKYGMILTDRTGLDVPHSIRQPMDPRVKVTVKLELNDFEVVYDQSEL